MNPSYLSCHWQQRTRSAALTRGFAVLSITLLSLLGLGYGKPAALYAEDLLVTQEIRYHMPDAGAVSLVWGVNGWQVAPRMMQPPGTTVKDKLMTTPMQREGDLFRVRLQLPALTKVDYGFLITAKRDDSAANIWEAGNKPLLIEPDGVLVVPTALRLVGDQVVMTFADGPLVTQEIRYQMIEAGAVELVWGVNDWLLIPAESRPAGTVIKNGLMHTPMLRQGDTFSTSIRAPVGTAINYGFMITSRADGTSVEPKWDGDQKQPLLVGNNEPSLLTTKVTLTGARRLYGNWELWLRLLAFIGSVIGLAFARRFIPPVHYPRTLFWLLPVILLLGLAIRLYAAWDLNFTYPDGAQRLTGDEPDYDGIARGFLAWGVYDAPGRVPLYPLWLAVVYFLTNGSYHAVPYLQALLGIAAILLTYLLGRRVFGPTAGILAAFMVAISYTLIGQSLHLLSEVLYTPVILMVAITLWDAIKMPSVGRFYWAGLWVGISALVRPALLFFPCTSLLLFGLIFHWRQALRYWLVYSITTVVVVLPWLVYNYEHHHAIFPLQTSNAILWQGSPEYYHLLHKEGYTYQRIWREIIHGPAWNAPNPLTVAGDRWWTQRALQSIMAEPLVYLRFAVEKVGTFWVGDPSADWGNDTVFSYQALRRIGYKQWDAAMVVLGRFLPLVALLALVVMKHYWRTLLPITALLLFNTLLHAATHAEARLSEPLQPFLLILIAGMLVFTQVRGEAVTTMATELQSNITGNSHSPARSRRWRQLLDLLRELVARDLTLRYRRSILGVVWSLLNPLLQLLVFHFVFRYILPLEIPYYALFLFCGLLTWNWLQTSLFAATTTIIDGGSLIKRPGFPAAILPVVTVSANFIQFLLALPILLFFMWLAGITPTITLWGLPFIIALQFVFTLSLTYFLATIHVTFRDTQHLVSVFLLLFFYLTPIFYDAGVIPAHYQAFYQFNPILHLVGAYRAILLHGEWPALAPLTFIAVGSSLLLYLSYHLFRRASYRFAEEL